MGALFKGVNWSLWRHILAGHRKYIPAPFHVLETIYQNYISSFPSFVFRVWHGTSVWNSTKDFLGSRTLIQNKTSSNLQQKSMFYSFPIIGLSKKIISHFVKMACKKITQGWLWPMILRRRVLSKNISSLRTNEPAQTFPAKQPVPRNFWTLQCRRLCYLLKYILIQV